MGSADSGGRMGEESFRRAAVVVVVWWEMREMRDGREERVLCPRREVRECVEGEVDVGCEVVDDVEADWMGGSIIGARWFSGTDCSDHRASGWG